MNPITIHAVYRNGVLKPRETLDLPENTPVQLQVTPVQSENSSNAPLFGRFPELGVITRDDLAWSKQLWERGANKQSSVMDVE